MAFEAKRLYYLLTSANGFQGETTDSTDSSELTNLTSEKAQSYHQQNLYY